MSQNNKRYVIIVAGGSGTRMSSIVPKQFIPIVGKPVLMHTIQKFSDSSKELNIILVLPSDQLDEWDKLCTQYNFNINLKIVIGGDSRFQSAKNGLDAINDTEGLVAIHDGVRPLINKEIIENSFVTAQKFGSAITSVALKDSIRFVNGDVNKHEDRKNFRLIQTPQTFDLALIKEAYKTTELSTFTDDASVLEHSGQTVHLIEGSYDNIKITTQDDLIFAEALLQK